MLGLIAGAGLLFGLTVWCERSAAEPILPAALFAIRGFVIPVTVIGIQAMALFGSLVYLPLFFQLVMGRSPSHAGLLMAPLMAGVILTSVTGGRLVSRTGRYKVFPVIGLLLAAAAFLAIGIFAEKAIGVTPFVIALVVLGAGLRLCYADHDHGAAECGSSSAISAWPLRSPAFLRSLGGALGVALSGAVVTTRLHMLLPPSVHLETLTHLSIGSTGSAANHAVKEAYRHAIATTFFTGSALAALAFVVILLLPEVPLRAKVSTSAHPAAGD